MVERHHRASLARFHVATSPRVGAPTTLDRDAAHHLRVLRLAPGALIGVTDGRGALGTGRLTRLAKSEATVDVDEVATIPVPPPIHLLVPVADRDRVLWLAEKCTELQIASWRPVRWQRSASVGPRGSGAAFQARVMARMVSALTQSGGAWLPVLHDERSLDEALGEMPPGVHIALDRRGAPFLRLASRGSDAPIVLALGPEGGLETAEQERLAAAGFAAASLGDTILRFETAGIAALAIARAVQMASAVETTHGSPEFRTRD
jgi:16S rRNA (uracil1498-N3)-methyltransferase